jgi:NitT/TauT family transport system substrate-binding protein
MAHVTRVRPRREGKNPAALEGTLMRSRKLMLLVSVAAVAMGSSQALSQPLEKVKLVTSFLGNWDTSQPSYCQERGEFAKAGLDVEVTNTRGGSENIQAVIAGGMDIGYSPGTNAVLAAYMEGAKIKVISAEFKGQNDTYFYVPTASPIKSIDDIDGKTIAYPRPGGASEALVLSLISDRKLKMKPVATGGLDATYTMTMTKQVDIGYSFPPFMLAAVDKGDVRILFSGNAVASQNDLTGRVTIASTDFLKNRRAVATKFLEVLDKCIDSAYANMDASAKWYGAMNKVDEAIAKKALGFYDRSTLAFGPVLGLDTLVKQGVEAKFIKPMSPEQVKDMVDILYTTPAKK